MELTRYSMGIGDRFGRQGRAQLSAFRKAEAAGTVIVPVWNKSFREHAIIDSQPAEVRCEAEDAVTALAWPHAYFVDADHITLENVRLFTGSSNFFTLDVAGQIGGTVAPSAVDAFAEHYRDFVGPMVIPGIEDPFTVTEEGLRAMATRYLPAVAEAARISQVIGQEKGVEPFVTELSMDECERAQTPLELFFILAEVARHGMALQTVAPKFSGRFNKGVDYVGDVAGFAREFEQDVCVVAHAVATFGLPASLKLSVHSGSDKFTLYPVMREILGRHDAGVHLKTAGTTWLEELAGLALAGGEATTLAKAICLEVLARMDELCAPYALVVDIDPSMLPDPGTLAGWSGEQLAAAFRHDRRDLRYNPHLRQLLHVGYKVAAGMGDRYLDALDRYEAVIAAQVTSNIYDRHLRPLFLG